MTTRYSNACGYLKFSIFPRLFYNYLINYKIMTSVLLLHTNFEKMITNKILNYKESDNFGYTDEDVSFWFIADLFDWVRSYFCDPHQKHIFTGHLWIIKNKKLRELLTKCPNCRDSVIINFSKALTEINTVLDRCINSIRLKTKYANSYFKPWKMLAEVKERQQYLKKKSDLSN